MRLEVDQEDGKVVLVADDEVVVAMDARTAYAVSEILADAAFEVTHARVRHVRSA